LGSTSILDFDGESDTFTYHDLFRIFPHNKIWIYNTYRGNGRFRAIFFIDRIVNAWAFRDICRSLKAQIDNAIEVDSNKSGRPSDLKICHGLDTSKFCCSSIFYAPRQSGYALREVDNFFVVQPGQPLDVLDLLKNPIHKKVEMPFSIEKAPSNSSIDTKEMKIKVNELISNYRKTPIGGRHDAFFCLAVELRKLGIIGKSMWSILIEADYDGSRRRDGDFEKINDTFSQNQRDGTYLFRNSRRKSKAGKSTSEIVDTSEEISVDDERFWLLH
jgi:hypothetical protein